MAIFSITKTVDPNSWESTIYCQVGITRGKRPKFATYISIPPEYFSGGTIVLPKKSNLSYDKILAKSHELRDYAERITKIQDYVQTIVSNGTMSEEEISGKFLSDLVMVCRDCPLPSLNHETIASRYATMISAIALQKKAKQDAIEEAKHRVKYDGIALMNKWLSADDHRHGEFSYDEIKQTKVVINIVRRWIVYTQQYVDRNFLFDVDKITPDTIRDLFVYMRDEHILEKRYPSFYSSFKHFDGKKMNVLRRGENTLVKKRKKIKAFFSWLNRRGITTNDPFKSVTIGSEKYGTPFYLTVEERNHLASYDFSARPGLATQRDIFIFQCHVGCRVSDLYQLTEHHISGGTLRYVPHKTKDDASTMAIIPLTDVAKNLIEKYKGVDSKGRLFPFISLVNYNRFLKEIFQLAGLTRKVPVRNTLTGETDMVALNELASSHMARRVFTASAYTQVQDPNIVGKMTGHSEGSKAFARYNTIGEDILASVVRSDKFMGTISVKDELHKLIDGLTAEQAEKVKEYIGTL